MDACIGRMKMDREMGRRRDNRGWERQIQIINNLTVQVEGGGVVSEAIDRISGYQDIRLLKFVGAPGFVDAFAWTESRQFILPHWKVMFTRLQGALPKCE